MRPNVKKFIEDNVDLIEQRSYDKFFKVCENEFLDETEFNQLCTFMHETFDVDTYNYAASDFRRYVEKVNLDGRNQACPPGRARFNYILHNSSQLTFGLTDEQRIRIIKLFLGM